MTNPLQNLGQVPHDKENEAIILVNAIRNKQHREKFSHQVDYREFRMPEFNTLAFAIQAIHNEKLDMDIDMLLLKSKICPIRKYLEYEFIAQLLQNFSENISLQNFEVHLKKLRTDHVKSSLLDRIFKSLYMSVIDPRTELSDVEMRINELNKILEKGYSAYDLNFKSMKEVVEDYKIYRDKGIKQRTTGFALLDKLMTQGLMDEWVSIIAGNASMGKSSFSLSMMNNLGNKGVTCPMFALEMPNMSLTHKLLAFNTDFSVKKVATEWDELEGKEKELYAVELERLARNKHIYLNDKPTQTLPEMREQIMLLQDKLQEQYMVVFVDLFGKIQEFQGSDNFARDYEKHCNTVQVMTRELGIHTVLVAQIVKSVMQRKFKRPTMNDLKNAGALTEVADNIFGIYRPFYDPEVALKQQLSYGKEIENVNSDPNANLAEILILKQRMGNVPQLLNFNFDPNTTRFSPIEETYQNTLNAMKFEEDEEDY
jgi:replicative DNA helicase